MKSLLDKYITDGFGENGDQSFYELDMPEQDAIFAQIRAYANANKTRFIQEVRTFDLQEELSPLPLVYEAIAKDSDNWSDFYVDEIKRVLDFSLTTDNPKGVLDNLNELVFNLDTADAPHIRKIMDMLGQAVEATNATVRREAIFLVSGILNSDNLKQYHALVSSITARLHDPAWRVRYTAYLALTDANALPAGFKLSLLDRLRWKYLNPFK